MLVERIESQLKEMAAYFAQDLVVATLVERALQAGGIDEWPENAGFSTRGGNHISISLYGAELQADKEWFTKIRRALGVPKMERIFDKRSGAFEFKGLSRTIITREGPLQVVIRAGSNGCTLKAVKETIEVTRYEADCGLEEVTE